MKHLFYLFRYSYTSISKANINKTILVWENCRLPSLLTSPLWFASLFRLLFWSVKFKCFISSAVVSIKSWWLLTRTLGLWLILKLELAVAGGCKDAADWGGGEANRWAAVMRPGNWVGVVSTRDDVDGFWDGVEAGVSRPKRLVAVVVVGVLGSSFSASFLHSFSRWLLLFVVVVVVVVV